MPEIKPNSKVTKKILESQPGYEEFIAEYQDRIKTAETKHDKKHQAIRDSRQFQKQILPEFSEEVLISNDKKTSNNNQTEARSKYCPPLSIVVGNKVASELTAMSMRFEFEANNEKGVAVAKSFMKIIQRTFAQTGNMSEHLLGIDHFIYSGTYIAQPVIRDMTYDLFENGRNPIKIEAGKSIGFVTYDPLGTLLDPNAVPGKVPETSDWLVVTIGLKTPSWIKERYNVDVGVEDREIAVEYGRTMNSRIVTIDSYKYELQSDSGLENQSGFMVREYYTKDGKVYHIIDDSFVAEEGFNSAGIKGIPFAVCPCILDLDSPYGIPIPEQLRPSVELVASAINMVADNTAMKNKLPYFYPNGMIDPTTLATLSSGKANKMNNYIPVNVAALAQAGGFLTASSINSLVQKPELQEVTDGAQLLLAEGMNSVWYITGLNPASISGIQQKQIRIESVADMINGASLRNSSRIVVNLETYMLNVMTRYFQLMYYNYYSHFNEFKELKVEKSDLKDIKAVRVVNGSYLPSDKNTREAKADFIYTMAQTNQVFDPLAVTEYVFEAFGMEMSRFTRNPLELLDEQQLMQLLADFMQKRTGQPAQPQAGGGMPQ